MPLFVTLKVGGNNKKNIYLGTAYKPAALYKIRDHKGLEFWDGQKWNTDTKILKDWCQTDLEPKASDRFKLLVSTSTEEGDQYKDGNGNDFSEQQIEKNVPYTNQYSNTKQKAFEKKTLLTKGQFNINDEQEIKLSYTANRSDNIL